ncbi:magnesium transporter CorA family protein [Methylobacterium adhaesivum]|uniref:Magnesium transporter CorA family protein n=1 Tax=Methylobacterium adhaesivum TaxID=333297 RepID=A0ABT8BIN9_9HYPH|nr:magnesium transporter CorA family protein [Methylobacterium adhaesivum]MDN3591748.1 magnesium transporter CorA family protein [Methylobacterium adhaesivum]
MISLHGPQGAMALPASDGPGPGHRDAVWIDLEDPSAEEAQRVEDATGLRVPSRKALNEVENSSRLRRLKNGFSLSTPMITFDKVDSVLQPLGFVLTKDHLVTVRFHELRAFGAVKKRIAEGDGPATTSTEIFLLLMEELVDSLADALEEMGADLDALSTRVFDFDVRGGAATGSEGSKSQTPRRRDLALRRILRGIGRRGKALGKLRASLLGLERIVPFVANECDHLLAAEQKPRFEAVRRDIASLDEFEIRQSENVQFLLDATLGLINMEQNNTFRVLTVVSVVGIPPTLVTSLYGMNFKHMPELDWAYGYPYGLALVILSALVPLVFFRIRGWI